MPPAWSCAAEVVAITEETDVAYIQSRARSFARAAGLQVRDQWAVAIAASELASNVVKFGAAGRVALRTSMGPPPFLEIEAVDAGPGFDDPEAAIRDGVSEGIDRTSPDAVLGARRGLGLGLGAVKRLMGELTIRSSPFVETVVAARLVLRERGPGRV